MEAFAHIYDEYQIHKLVHLLMCSLDVSIRHLTKCYLEQIKTTTIDCRQIQILIKRSHCFVVTNVGYFFYAEIIIGLLAGQQAESTRFILMEYFPYTLIQ